MIDFDFQIATHAFHDNLTAPGCQRYFVFFTALLAFINKLLCPKVALLSNTIMVILF